MAKNNDSDGEDGSGSESESSDYWNTNPKKPKSRKEDPKKISPVRQPSRTKFTLSSLLNTLDGPRSREGQVVILTANAPDFLDEASYGPDRVDTQVYLGFDDEITAVITFIRIFGSNKEVEVPQNELGCVGRRFGHMVPIDFFTPANI